MNHDHQLPVGFLPQKPSRTSDCEIKDVIYQGFRIGHFGYPPQYWQRFYHNQAKIPCESDYFQHYCLC